MSSTLPFVKQIAWLSLIPQIVLIGALIYLGYISEVGDPVNDGLVVFFILFFVLRYGIPRSHTKGIKLIKRKEYNEAIEYFKMSYDFFNKKHWIDRYRFIILLSSSRISYKEMALLNTAFCYGQLGHGKPSREFYEKTLTEFPDSEIAKTALNMLNAAKSS
jgi:tetratricopeptide (TPR) repeat protein